MSKPVKFVLNRANFRKQILRNAELQDRILDAAQQAVDDRRVTVTKSSGRTRDGVTLACPAGLEAKHGTLTQTLGRIHVS